jgi:hypothetical protein
VLWPVAQSNALLDQHKSWCALILVSLSLAHLIQPERPYIIARKTIMASLKCMCILLHEKVRRPRSIRGGVIASPESFLRRRFLAGFFVECRCCATICVGSAPSLALARIPNEYYNHWLAVGISRHQRSMTRQYAHTDPSLLLSATTTRLVIRLDAMDLCS